MVERSVGEKVDVTVGRWVVPMDETMVGYLEPCSAANLAYVKVAQSADLLVESMVERSVGEKVDVTVGKWVVPMAEMMVGYLEPRSAANSAYLKVAQSADLLAESMVEHSVGEKVDMTVGK